MRIRSSRWGAVMALLLAAAVTVVLVRVLTHDKHAAPSTPLGTVQSAVTIPAAGGARLSAQLYAPAKSGSYPLIVMPGSWGSAATEYAAVANGFAALGFLVVAYAQRGLGGSTGAADFAGTPTRDDVSTVIDWAHRHAHAATDRVALVGASYGAGVGLLAAEHDRRIKAVAALSGWADFTQTIAPGNTPSEVAYRLLFTTMSANTALSSSLRTLVTDLAANRPAAAMSTIRAMAPTRSPMTDVAALNANHTAVFLTGTYDDSIAPPGNLIDFYRALTGPKRLELDTGDHGANILTGLQGQKTQLWVDIAKWVGQYLAGATSLDNRKPVLLRDAATGALHAYATWPQAGAGEALRLGPASGSPATGTLQSASTPANAWTRPITAGVPTTADAGPEQVTTGQPYQAPTLNLAGVSRTAGLVWQAAPAAQPTLVSGTPGVHLVVRSSASTASLFAYLYDVDANGTGHLMSFGATTLDSAGLPQGEAADISLGPISWTVPAGDRLALVIDSVDARYLGQSVPGSTITLAGTAADPAELVLPVTG